MFKNTASQKLTCLAFADAGHASLDAGERVTGDAANITGKVEQDDDGTRTAIADTNPTETEDGQYVFDITAAECNGDKLTFYLESSTAGVQVVALPSSVIYTRPPNFSDLGIESDGDLTKVNTLNGHTAQTGDSYARIGAPAGASVSADIATVDGNVDAVLVDTGTTLPASIATIDGNVDSILVDTGTTLPATLATIEGKVDTVDANVDAVLVDTGTTLPASIATVDANVDAVLVDTGTTLPATLSTIEGKVDTVDGVVDAVLVDTGTTLPATLGTPAGADMSADIAAVKADTAATLVDTGTTLPASLTAIEADTQDLQTQIGTAGAGLTDLGGMSTAMKAEVEAEVNDAIDTAISELGVAAPTATPTLRTGMMLMYMALRNKLVVQTSGTDAIEIYNDAGTKIASKTITDDGSDYTEAEMA